MPLKVRLRNKNLLNAGGLNFKMEIKKERVNCMRAKWLRIFSLALTVILIVGTLAACGTKQKDTGTTTQNTGTTENSGKQQGGETTTETKAGMEGWKPFEKNVTIKIPVYDRGVEGLPPVDNNYWTKWIQQNFGDKYNITVTFEPIPRNDVMTKYALLIAAKETPTILMEYDYPKVSQWASEGAMREISLDEFAKVAPTYYQAMVDNDLLQYTSIGGKTYFVCAVRPYAATEYKWVNFYRMDWLRKVGYDHVPTNIEEEIDALTKIKEAGLTDIEPMSLKLPTANYQANLFREFPLDEKEWAMHAGIDVAALPWEPVKKAIKKDNLYWHLGLVTKEFELNDDATERANFIAGKLYSYGGYMASYVDWLDAFYKNNPDAELAIGTVLYDDKGNITFDITDGIPSERSNTPFGMVIGFSSIASDDQLKAAWMYLEWMKQDDVLHTMQYGIEGIHYTEYDEYGYPVLKDMTGMEERLGYNDNKDYWCVVVESKERDTIEDSIAAIAPKNLPQDFTQDMIDMYYVKAEKYERGWIYPDPIFTVTIESMNEYRASLLSLFQEFYTKLVKCDPDEFDALYEELSKQYLEAGYQEIMDEKLAAYEAGNSTRLPEKSRK
ncbi:sugar ABC transporter substrate-binding protein [Thermoclostridium stercorarium subsp. thermolacticum DSM 2910]|nr:ABC transporter periplasmic subunit [Thermoclostridium stercorarium subsp. stercorarium DSM 8532]ANW99896.1 sugar ABC transporter substrate-binding protein [Thermoclostridium stercorarium subsp. thermolacticum DSM 2910]ANX02521.1 sugar ABC transporter substrate-binding protein [Thermoclostridium stercorarium subsp. leptospartum DSM 9219]